jgi:hypothetical protein
MRPSSPYETFLVRVRYPDRYLPYVRDQRPVVDSGVRIWAFGALVFVLAWALWRFV